MCIQEDKEKKQIFYTPLEANIPYSITIRSVVCLQVDKENKQIP
jgi:hypothetical protein